MRRDIVCKVIASGRMAAAPRCSCTPASFRTATSARQSISRRNLSTSPTSRATTLPITGAGPPPSAPEPKPKNGNDRVAAHRRKTALLETAKEIRAQQEASPKSSPLKRRFWQHVHVEETPEGYQIMLDKRPVRTPSKNIITIPLSKPHLAHAIAIEWDMLNSAQEALKNHKIPITSILSRAHDIVDADAAHGTDNEVRDGIVKTMMRYLDTDTLLCWAPEKSSLEAAYSPDAAPPAEGEVAKKSLRDLQMETAKPIIAFLTGTIWPGVSITPTLDPNSIIPIKQSEMTRSVISGWITGLPAYELAALERAVLATKSLLVGARLVVEWSEEFRHLQSSSDSPVSETISTAAGGKTSVDTSTTDEPRFGIESAAHAANLEVSWQTGMWGEVEDTHDVEKEDVRRQLGSAVLMVSGRGGRSRS